MKPIKTTQRLLAYTLIHLIAFQPLLPAMAAGVQVATGNTALDKAGNGVPVINIATPNSAGISHNQYHDFNVDKPGLILNNGTEQLNPTQLGGLIQNNPNLKGKAADAIINEVVSTNRSTLAGYLEVGGKQASVIVANPNGITCDGCGFINTPQVTLTTGKPQLDAQGNLQRIDVTRGDITLTGQGLDASKSDYLSLISRTAQINAGLNANDARIVLGANQVDAAGKVTVQDGAVNNTVKVALDTGALGGMYTNRIKLVSSDKGVGVNIGNLSARSGDITLSANGKLSLGDAVAQGTIQADADALALQGKQQAGSALTLQAKQDIALQGATLRAGHDIDLQSGGALTAQNSAISAGVDAQGAVKSGNQLSIKSDSVTVAGTQLAAGKVVVDAGKSLQQDANSGIKANSVLDVRGETVSLAGMAGADAIHLEAKNLNGAGSAQLQAKNNATVRVTQQGDWQGNLTAGNALTVDGGRLVQRGTLAGKTLVLTLDDLDNQGDIASLQGLTFSGTYLTNGGTLAAAEQMMVSANRLDNNGLLSAQGDVRLELRTVLNNQGKILTDNPLFLLADSVINGGSFQAATLTARTDQFTNQGEVAANELDLTSQTTENYGTINAQQMLMLHGGHVLNGGTLSAGEKLALTLGQTLDNRGLMQAGRVLQVTADRLSNDDTLTAPELQLHTGTLVNRGALQADNVLHLDATRELTQSTRGKLLAGTELTLNAGKAETDGAIQAQQFLINAERWLNASKTSIDGDGQITAVQLENRGSLLTAGSWTIVSDAVNNAGMLQGHSLDIQAGTLTNSGKAQALGAVTLTVADSFTNSGDWLSGDALRIQAANVENRGALQALTLTASGESLNNSGNINGINSLSLSVNGNLDNAGTLQGNQLHAEAARLTNQGTIYGTDALTLAIAGSLSNQGSLLSEGDGTVTVQQLDNTGALQAKNVVLQADLLDNAGTIFGIASLALTVTNGLTNQQHGKLLTQGTAVLTAANVVNAGEWQAQRLTLTADNLTNNGEIQGDDALSLMLPTTDGKGTLVNHGTLTTGGDATLFARLMENQGTLSSLGHTTLTNMSLINDGRLVAATGLSLYGDYRGSGLLNTAGTLTLHGDTLVNDGHWESRALSLQGKHLTNQGTVLGNTVALSLDQLTNHGDITGIDTLTLSLGDSLNNIGTLRSDSLSVAAAEVNNRGDMQGINTLQLNTTGLLDNSGVISGSNTLTVTADAVKQSGTLEGKTVTLDATSLVNQGKILGVDALTLAIVGTVANSGNVLTQGNGSVTAQQVDNSGLMQAGSLTLQADDIVNAGQLLGIDALSITAQHGLTNQQNGKLLTQGEAVLQAAQVENHGEWRADNLTLRAAHFINTGRVQADRDIDIAIAPTPVSRQRSFLPMALSLAADIQQLNAQPSPQNVLPTAGKLNNRGMLVSGGDTRLRATQLANQGSLASNGAATIIGEMVENDGDIVAVTGLSLAGNYQGRGSLQTDGLLDWSGTTLANRGRWQANAIRLQGLALDNQGTLLGQRTDITAATLFNGGEIAGVDALQLTVADSLINQGQLYGATLGLSATDLSNQGELSGDALHLTLQDSVRNSGLISGSQRVQLEADQIEQLGSLESRDLRVQANALDNQGTMLGVDALTLAINTTARNNGKWLSQGDSTLTVSRLENRGQWQAKTLTLTADDVENAGQVLGLSALSLTAKNRLDNTQNGKLLTQGLAVLHATNAENDGEWQANSLTLDAQNLLNRGHIQGDKSLKATLVNGDVDNKGTLWSENAALAARTLTNEGNITGVNDLQLTLDNTLTNQGSLNSYQLTAQADRLDNSGKINGLDQLGITVNESLDNAGTLYGAALALKASDLTNSGVITGVDSLTLDLTGALNNARDVSSNALMLKANDVFNYGTLTGVNGLTLELSNHLDNQGALNSHVLAIAARDVTNGGLLNGTRGLQLTLGGGLTNTGDLTSQRIDITAEDVLNHGQMLGSGDLQLNLRNKLDNRGVISGSNTLGIIAKSLEQQGTLEARVLTVDAQTLDNHGKMLGVDVLTLAITGTARNQGKWLSQGSSTLTADQVENHGQWQAGDLTLQANDLINNGQIFGLDALSLTTNRDLTNQKNGTLLSQGIAVLRAAGVTNDGEVQADRLTFEAQQLTNRGRMQGDRGVVIMLDSNNPASLLTNQGSLLSGDDTQLNASQFDNQGSVSGVGKIAVQSASIRNAGNLIADGALSLSGDYQGVGLLHTADTLTLRGNQLNNGGRWESRELVLNGGSLNSQGTIVGERGMTLELRDDLTVGRTGQLLTNGALQAQADKVINDGFWQGKALTLTGDDVENAGQLLGLSALSLTAKNRLNNTQNGKLLTQGLAVLHAVNAENDGEWQADNLTLDAQNLNNRGHIQGDKSLQVTLVNGDVDNMGTLWSENAALAARTLTNEGNITGVNGLQLTLDNTLTNQGVLNSYQLTAQADRLDNSGKINGLDQLGITVNEYLDNAGTLYGAALALKASDLTNSGAITGVNGLTLELSNHLDNQGALNSHVLAIAARDVTNGGLLNGTRGLQLTLGGGLTNTGDFTSQRIDITAEDALNHGQMLGSGDLQLNVRNKLDNRGVISGSNTLGIIAKSLEQQGTLEARVLTVDAQTLDNHGKMLGVDVLTLAITGTARNQGKWLSQGSSTLTADQVENHGQWQAGDLTLQANDLINNGQIFGLDALSLTTNRDLTNQKNGTLLSQGIAVLRAAGVTNDGEVQVDRLTFEAQQLINRGRMQGDRGVAITLDGNNPDSLLTNQGTLFSGGDTQLNASQFDNHGSVSGVGKMEVQSAAIRNAGSLIADGALSLIGDYQGAGLLHTADTLTLRGNQLSNGGRWESRELVLNGGSLNNQGTIVGERGITLELRDELTVGNVGQLLTNGALQALAGEVINDGFWQGKALELSANGLTNGGSLLGQNNLHLDVAGAYQGTTASRVLSDGEAAITAERLTQSGDIAAGTLNLTTGTLENGGRVLGLNGLTVTNRDKLLNRAGGELLTNGAGRLDSGTLSNAGVLQANDLQLRANEIDNQGRIQGTGALRLLDVLRYVGDKSSQLLSNGAATLNAKRAENAGLWQAGALTLNSESLDNRGTVAGLNSLSLNGDELKNQGDLFSQGTATLIGKTLENSGTLTGVGGFTLQLTDRVDNLAAGRLLSGGVGELTTGVLSNQGLWQADDLRLTARDLEQRGNLLGVQRGTLQLTGAYQGAQGSQLVSGGGLSLTAHDMINRGQIQGRTLTLGADELTNHGTLRGDSALNATVSNQFSNAPQARLSSDGTLNVQAAALNNQGEIKAANTTLTGMTVTNSGTVQGTAALQLDATDRVVNQQTGQLLSDGSTTLKSAAVENHGWLQGRGLEVQSAQFIQQGSLMAQDKLTLKIPQWVNNGLVQAGELEIIADELDNHGTLLGLTQLALQTQRLINRQGAKLYSAQDLRLKTNGLQQDGQLVALGNLTADITGPLIFTQSMAAGQQLVLNVTGDLEQRGTLQGKSVQLTSTGMLTNQGNILAGGGESRISAKDIVQLEAGSVQAGGNLTLVSDNTLNNKGLIGTTSDLLVQAGGALHNSSMLYAGGNMRLLSDSLTNVFGTILAGNNLWVQRDAQGTASTSLLNSSGTIETQSGDITINTGTLTNQREGLVVTESESTAESVPDWVGKTTVNIPIEWFKEGSYGVFVNKGHFGTPDRTIYAPLGDFIVQRFTLKDKKINVVAQGNNAVINSGHMLSILSDDLINRASSLYAADNIFILGNKFENSSYHEGGFTEYLTYAYIGPRATSTTISDYHHQRALFRYISYQLDGTPTYEKTEGESYNALIQAGGTITADFKQDISNTTLQPGSGGFMPASTKPVLDAITTLSPLQKQTTRQLVSQDSSFNAGAIDVTKAGSGQATLAGNATGVATTGKAVTLTQQAGTALQTAAQAESITAMTQGQQAAGPLTLNTGDAVVLQPSTSGHVSNPDAVTLTQQSGTALQTAAQAGNITPLTQGQQSAGPLTLKTDDALVLTDPNASPVAHPDAVALTSTGQRPDTGQGLTPVNVDNTVAGVTIAGTVGAPVTLAKPGSVAVETLKQTVSTGNLPGGATPSVPQPLSAAELLSAIGNGLQNLSTNPLAEYPLPTGNNGLLVVDPNADSRYLIHTNPKLEQLGQVDNAVFSDLQTLLGQQPSTVVPVETRSQWTQADKVLGSSYLLDKLNLDADHDYRFLGDAEFDTRYINQAVLKQSGQRYLNGTGSDLTQMQMLLDNAAVAQKGMNLQLGVSLTPDQVANLSQSMVWWENIEINGQTVLAPKLYLAQADKNNLQGSAIVANKIELNAGGSVTNSGTLKAVEVLAIASGDKIDNQDGGLIKSDGGLNLVALNNITNSGSRIEGNTLQLASINGDIINQTASRNFQTAQPTSSRSGTGSLTFTELGKTAEIVAGNSLTLSAGKDIRNVAATLNAGQDMALNAKGNVAIEALTLTNNRVDIGWGSSNTALNTAVQGSTVNAGGALKAVAGQDIQIDASQLSGGTALSLAAGNDIRLTAQDTLKETLYQGGSTAQRRTQNVANSQLLSGGDLALVAGRDVLSEAASLNAKGTATLAAGRDLNLLSEEKETYSGNWWNRHADWQQNITQQSTELTTGKDLNLQAGRDINLQAAQGMASGTVTAQAGNDINLLSATETQHTFFEETKVKKKTFSKTVTHTVRDDFRSNEKESVLSGDRVVLQADHDINMTGSVLSGEQLVALNAGNDIDMAASVETQRVYEKQTKKKSGLMSGGGLGFTIGKQSSSAEYNGAQTRQSESRSVVGAVNGDVLMQSGQRIAISGSDIIAGGAGNIAIRAQEIDITPGQDTRDITIRSETKSSGIGIALKGTPYDSYQNLRDIGKTEGITQKARLYMSEAAAMVFDVPQIALSIGRNSSKTEQHTQGVYQTGSALTAAGNIQLQTLAEGATNVSRPNAGNILVSGSTIQAGGNLLLDAMRDINVQSASDWEKTAENHTQRGWSFSNAIPGIGSSIRHLSGGPNHGVSLIPFASESAREKQQGDTVAQTASTLGGKNVTLNSQQRDILITGSAVTGINDVSIVANNGNVIVNPGQNHARNETAGSSSAIGDLGGDGYSGTVGWRSNRYHSVDDVNQQSSMRSLIQSGDGDIGIVAKDNVVIAGTDVQAGKSLIVSGRDITVDPAVDTEHRLREQQNSQYGVTTALSGYAVSALQAVERLSQSVEDKRDPRLSAIYAAQAALNLATQTVANNMNASAIKVTVSVGGGSSQSKQQQDAVTREGSTLSAHDDIRMKAEQDLTLVGADVRGRNIELSAGKSLTLASAQSESQLTGTSSSQHAGVGVGFGLGGQQNGFTVELSASGQKGKENGNSETHQLTQVAATESVNLRSGSDTVLDGAVVSGKQVVAEVGGDLLISSPQDTSRYDSKTTSAGLNVSICVPPICAGQTVSGNANLSQQILNNHYASVQEQSGIRAGEGGFTIRTDGHTQLDGAIISSEAAAEKNRLTTGTLGWQDIINVSRYNGTGFNLGVSTDSMPTAGLGLVKGDQTGVTYSAVSPATIEISNSDAQQQDIATLSRDTSGANGSVKDGFDRGKIEDKLTIQREATALGVQALDAYKTSKKGEAEELARARLIAEGVPAFDLDERVKTSHEVKQVEKEYGVGSAFWMAGSALTSLASGGLGGNLNGALSGAAAPYLAALVKDVTAGSEPARIALHTALGAVLAHTQGGNAVGGAAGGLVSSASAEVLTNLLYPEVKKGDLSAEQKQLIANLVTIAGAGAGGIAGGNLAGAGSGANTAKNEVENNSLAISCAHEPMACAKNPWLEGGAGPGGLAGGVSAAGAGAVIGEALNGDKDKSEQDSDQPNVGKNLSEGEKAELGGTGSGTPDGWGPEDEENARRNDDVSSNIPSRDKLNQAASASNRNGMTDAGRALQKHGGREGSVYSYSSQKASVLNQEAQTVVNEILNNTNTKIESRVVFENKQKITVVEATAPDGRALRFNADGTRLIGFREPPSK
ncbi:filamentous hemagglutinin family outer membrane protein [Pectobacterium parmentieri WPP163]|uniref:hemagglutinin repeat-containing protein n=1 Tax=Pectobacterium parmentieri TaxID=1905730 RepID=UPI0001BA11B8|nr:hemagglutinin repeat-containing protein [Pectobacterium parmentieri]ACX88282.1 filamentous hemagglutinin family outer membrane protein [Pectobacterium parmentieri WPP163]